MIERRVAGQRWERGRPCRRDAAYCQEVPSAAVWRAAMALIVLVSGSAFAQAYYPSEAGMS